MAVTPNTSSPGITTTIPSDQTARKQQIASLITHIARQDNHLWQALNSLQNQTNGIVNQTTDWTSWNPALKCYLTATSTVPVVSVDELSAYYMVSGQICYIELWTNTVVLQPGTEKILLDLPVDIGDTISKTCSAWLVAPTLLSYGNGICSVECLSQTATLVINPNFANVTCRFMMGGALGIIQTPNPIQGVDTAPR